jgi:hypothetical protein
MGFTYANSRSRRFVYGLDGKLDHHKYLNDTLGFLLNRFEARLGGYAGVKLASKTDLRLGYHREFIHYSAGRTLHSKSHKFDLGVHGQLAPKVTGRVGAGIQLRRYAEPTAGQPDNITTLLTDIGVTYKPFLRTQIGLKLFRNTVETTFSTSRYYEATGASLDYIQRFQKLTLTTNFQFETDRYPETTTLSGITANRRDDIYSGGLILKYDFKKWLSASLNYKRRQRHSTFFGEFDYVSDISGMDMSVAF